MQHKICNKEFIKAASKLPKQLPAYTLEEIENTKIPVPKELVEKLNQMPLHQRAPLQIQTTIALKVCQNIDLRAARYKNMWFILIFS